MSKKRSLQASVVEITSKDSTSLSVKKFPFKTTLCLAPLISYWKNKLKNDPNVNTMRVNELMSLINKNPALLKPIEDHSVIDQHIEVIDFLMEDIFPSALWENDLRATVAPFHFESFYGTPRLNELRLLTSDDTNRLINLDSGTLLYRITLSAYMHILYKFYKISFLLDQPFIFTITDKYTGLDRYFRLNIDHKFMAVKANGPVKPLTDQEINFLINRYNNLDLWMQTIPADNFEFSGFGIYDFVDVTNEEVTSALRYELLNKDSISSEEGFDNLQQKLRILYSLPNLQLGLATLHRMQEYNSDYVRRIWHGIVLTKDSHYNPEDLFESVYENVLVKGHTIIVDNLEDLEDRTKIERDLLKKGIRNLIIAPLYYDNRIIGILELGSPIPGELNAISTIKLKEVLPLFAIAVNREVKDLENNIQTVIREKYTAIHPVVEWRFNQAAINLLQRLEQNKNAEIETIIFKDIYPLFGVADIRRSSAERNKAIQGDLTEHLELAQQIINEAKNSTSLAILDEINYNLKKHLDNVREELNTGDETVIVDFLQSEIEPLLVHFQETDPDSILPAIARYQEAINNPQGVVYTRRKAYEESMLLLNDAISALLEKEEEKAQEIFPHYFEKYKTDGLEHDIYIGASLLQNRKFEPIYLKNLRLWQLIMTCEIARKANKLKASLKVPLEITQLILVHSSPLSIRFRVDEKKFDVEGAENIRYEVLKKRVDKALIRETEERLCQPGKVAIVYTQIKEAEEYYRYLEYLIASDYITDEIEDLDLEELQGVQGLKALRITVNLKKTNRKKRKTQPDTLPPKNGKEYAEGKKNASPELKVP